jgi:tetraacyldisaccharide 4'-kinase
VDSEAFPDHNRYTGSMVNRLLARAEEQDLSVVTTEKDMVKMPRSTRGRIWPVPVELEWDDAAALEALLDGVVG